MKETGFPFSLSLEGDRVRIVAELPGITEEKIRLDLDGKTLTISAADGGRHPKTPVALPWDARLSSRRFRKGVLELILERSG